MVGTDKKYYYPTHLKSLVLGLAILTCSFMSSVSCTASAFKYSISRPLNPYLLFWKSSVASDFCCYIKLFSQIVATILKLKYYIMLKMLSWKMDCECRIWCIVHILFWEVSVYYILIVNKSFSYKVSLCWLVNTFRRTSCTEYMFVISLRKHMQSLDVPRDGSQHLLFTVLQGESIHKWHSDIWNIILYWILCRFEYRLLLLKGRVYTV